MPKFIYTIILLSLLSWLELYHYISHTAPDTLYKIVFFLFILFVALALTFSLPIYLIFHVRVPSFSNLKYLYRRSLKWALFLSFGVSFSAALWIFNLANLVNLALFVILYALVFMQLRGRR